MEISNPKWLTVTKDLALIILALAGFGLAFWERYWNRAAEQRRLLFVQQIEDARSITKMAARTTSSIALLCSAGAAELVTKEYRPQAAKEFIDSLDATVSCAVLLPEAVTEPLNRFLNQSMGLLLRDTPPSKEETENVVRELHSLQEGIRKAFGVDVLSKQTQKLFEETRF